MSLQELEQKIRQLRTDELIKFAEWFDGYCAEGMPAENPDDISEGQKAELRRRKTEYLSNRAIASDWDEASFDRFIKQLEDAHSSRASRGPA